MIIPLKITSVHTYSSGQDAVTHITFAPSPAPEGVNNVTCSISVTTDVAPFFIARINQTFELNIS